MNILLYVLIGAITGVLSGLFGIGGGVVSVPSTAYIFSSLGMSPAIIMHLAEGTSIAAIVFNMVAAVFTHHKNKMIVWDMVKQLAPGIILGCIFGVCVASCLPGRALKIVFGIFVLVTAIQLLLSRQRQESTRPPPSLFIQRSAGILIGVLSGLLGVGGGIVAIPLLLRFNLPMHNAAATSTTCALLACIIGTISFAIAGLHVAGLPAGATGFVYWPAAIAIGIAGVILVPYGVKFAQRLSALILKRIFAVLLLVIGLVMVI